jgi:hypothetical protein
MTRTPRRIAVAGFITTLVCLGCQSGADHNDEVLLALEPLVEAVGGLLRSGDQEALEDLQAQIAESRRALEDMAEFRNDASLHEQAKSMVTEVDNMTRQRGAALVELCQADAGSSETRSWKAGIVQVLESELAQFNEVQRAFAQRHQFKPRPLRPEWRRSRSAVTVPGR